MRAAMPSPLGLTHADVEGLIRQLEYSFEVDVIDAFEFVTRDEIDETDPSRYRSPTHRVVAWSLEDASELQAGPEKDAAIGQKKHDRAELANVPATQEFAFEAFVAALLRASSK
jgi:hypothetical protein